MNFIELININPILSSIYGISIIILNFLFCYKVSLNNKIINNDIVNFICFNIFFYIIISSILLLFLFIKIELETIKILIFTSVLFQCSYFFYGKKINLSNFKYFDKFDYIIILVLFLFTFPQVTDADSLDYHLGGVIDIIRSGGLYPRNDGWYHFRLIGLGEMINLYGLFFYSKNFGQLFQVLAFSNIILIFKLFNKNSKLNYLILSSFPIFGSIILSAKQLLIVTNCYLLVFSILLLKLKISKKVILFILILIIAPIGFKHSYLIYSLPIWIYLFFHFKNNINILEYIKYSILIFFLITLIFYLKNIFYYGDPISPFLEFLKENPDKNILKFANDLRYSSKIFEIWEFFIIPFMHFIPQNLSEISLILSPIILSIYFIYFCKNERNIFLLLLIIFCLLFLSGKSQSRYFLDLYLMSTLILLSNLNLIYFKKYINIFIITLFPFSLLTIALIIYSVSSLSYPTLNEKNFKKTMNQKAHNYEIITWINKKIKDGEIVFYDETIRSKAFQKHNFVYYNISSKSIDEIRKIIKYNKINKIVLSKQNFELNFKTIYKCEILDKKPLNQATRNPINIKKNIANIYILDTRCLDDS